YRRILMIGKLLTLSSVVLAAGWISTAQAQDKPFEGVTLRVLTTQQPWDVEVQKRIGAFEEKTGATVQFDMYSFSQAVQKVAVELTSRSPAYDLVFVESSEIARFAPGGFLEPLGAQVKDDSAYNLADFIPSTVKGFSYKDELYGLPHFAATQVL